ncbi:MAG: ferritin-like domain-containing protein [Chloroflexota bacterium]
MNDTGNIKSELIAKLRDAAELEHQYMCQYLYAALSIKNKPDATCKPYQLEMARRWVSMLYLVARQEMEHLALVNNLLRSIGAAPHFYRANIGDVYDPAHSMLAHIHIGAEMPDSKHDPHPVPQEYAFTPFDLNTIKRFVCMESPNYTTLKKTPGEPFPPWCFTCAGEVGSDEQEENEVSAGDVQKLYKEIEKLFKQLPPEAFDTEASEQPAIIQQYDIFVFPVTDHASAQQAIDLIAEQGEGINKQPTYQSHYRRFIDIYHDYCAELCPDWDWQEGPDGPPMDDYDPATASFQPAYVLQKDPSEGTISNDYTKKLFALFNQAYETQVTLLTGLYATKNQKPTAYPYFASALGQEAFSPFMTMIIRTCGEILLRLKTDNPLGPVGPNFHLSSDLQADLKEPFEKDEQGNDKLKPRFGNIEEILKRTEDFSTRLQELVDNGNPPTIDGVDPAFIQKRMEYMLENANRISTNLRRIYQLGIYQALDAGQF